MARYYNRRRFARRVRRMRRSKRSSLSRVKKDILKCNFPTKVKFMGLTERKVMFLTKNLQISMKTGQTTQQIVLDPMNTDNVVSLIANTDLNVYNWDKMCILGIYIKFQPLKNTWSAVAPDAEVDNINIEQVKCIYSMNIVDLARPRNAQDAPYGRAPAIAYDTSAVKYKQVFTFNSNESFTMYIPAPTTMSSDDPCVHKSKTWWSIANIQAHASDDGDFIKGIREDYDDDNDNDRMASDDDDTQNYGAIYPKDAARPYICAGRLFFSSAVAKYNVTINYKVALKG